MTALNIALVGYGKMGQIIDQIAQERCHQVVARLKETPNKQNLNGANLVIEFSKPETAFENIKNCIDLGIPVVCGTTGWLDQKPEIENLCQKQNGAFLYGSNFSLGVNLFFALNQQLAQLMNRFPSYQCQLTEVHHTHKKDAPSGTAISLANGILEHHEGYQAWQLGQTDAPQLGIIAERTDEVPGTHHVKYSSEVDDIEISHTAHTRHGFALGAVIAAEWLHQKTGVFGMKEVLGL
jgi:4-hydroxy-tetrahydrodipicolinate reductase